VPLRDVISNLAQTFEQARAQLFYRHFALSIFCNLLLDLSASVESCCVVPTAERSSDLGETLTTLLSR
jgi:hypothetical protein